MNWQFQGLVRSKDIFPLSKSRYLIAVTNKNIAGSAATQLPSLLSLASCTLEVMRFDSAVECLQDLGGKGQKVLGSIDNSKNVAFVWHDHSLNSGLDNHLFVVVGLEDTKLSQIAPDIDRAMVEGFQVTVSCVGGFSISESNPYSNQPTQEQFETGIVLQFQDAGSIRITVLNTDNN